MTKDMKQLADMFSMKTTELMTKLAELEAVAQSGCWDGVQGVPMNPLLAYIAGIKLALGLDRKQRVV